MKLIILMFMLFSCNSKQDEVEVYDSPKVSEGKELKMEQPSAPAAMPAQMPEGMAAAPKNSKYKWSTPEGWEATVKSNMRLASFTLPAKSKKVEEAADLSIVVLGGDGGGPLSNINRWRGQLDLAPIDEATLVKTQTKFKGKLGTFSFSLLENPKTNQGMLTAMIMHEGSALFIKAMGPLSTLEQYKKAYIEFVKDIHVE